MTYVAIGDSYAAGVGGGVPEDHCGHTPGYPMAVSRALGLPLRDETCQGATAVEATQRQVGAVEADSTLVTVTVGGNDLDFTGVLTEAAKPAWLADSGPVLDRTDRRVAVDLPPVLTALYSTLQSRAPSARVVVLGYPALFSDGDCSVATFFTDVEIGRLNAVADRLAEAMATICSRVGVEFVDVREEFVDHGTCADEEWLHGASWPLDQSFHPNAAGHAAYGRVAVRALGHPEPVPADRPQPDVTRGAAPERPHPVFAPPDLTAPESLRAARAWGLDPDRVATLARRVQVAHPDPQAAEELKALHQQVRVRRGWA